jgi:hypothetical protein
MEGAVERRCEPGVARWRLAGARDAGTFEIGAAELDPVLRSRLQLESALAGLMADRQRRNAERRRAFDADARPPAGPSRDDLLTRIRSLFRKA